ncbi:MAG: ABC transporter permease [Phocaeicola sp.]|uniref:ABC transporter permease n=1 Tax=Phocaeicola sp. TaxID=2773926 RepID=UPI003FA158A9
MRISFHIRIWQIAKREFIRIASRPLYMFSIFIAPLFCYIFFTTLMWNGLPTNLPLGIVDLDNTATTRQIIRNLDAFQQTKITKHYANFTDARIDMQKGKIYAFYYIPQGTTQKAISSKQPTVSFYSNYTYLVAGSLLYKDQRTMSELARGAIGRATLRAKGFTDKQAEAILQPIVIDTHPINNPWLNYSVYLTNILIPGVLVLLIFMTTIYTIGSEIKDETRKEWMALANNNISIALAGKLIPQTMIYFLMSCAYNAYLYGYLHFPCHSGIVPMLFISLLMVLASQAFSIFLYGAISSFRLSLSVACLWGVVSFSICGMSFPTMAMHPILQGLAYLFPLRHYYLLYVNSALNGYSLIYAWPAVVALLLFTLLPFIVLKHLNKILTQYKYIP